MWIVSLGIAVVVFTSAVRAFSFTTNDPTQCDDFTISWSGGNPPFELLLTPVFGTPRNITVPSSAYSNGQGSYSVLLPFPQAHRFVASMSDAEGFGTGGTTTLLTVGASKGGSCNTTDPGVDFTFELNDSLNQCRTYTFSGYTQAVQPVTILALIPGGQSAVLEPPKGPTSYDWTVNVFNGTSLIFIMTDSEGNSGGSSDLMTVGSTDDVSCINKSSPSSTVSSSASSPTSATSAPAPSGTSTSSSSTPFGAIAGTVIGGLIFLAVLITLGLFFLKRRRERQGGRRPLAILDSGDNLSHPSQPYHYSPPAGYPNTPSTSPFLSQYSPPAQPSSINPFSTPSHSRQPSGPRTEEYSSPFRSHDDPFVPQNPGMSIGPESGMESRTSRYSSQLSMSSAQRKAAMAGVSVHKSSRFVLHTDIEDAVPPDNGEEVIELPPQYSERRAPPPS